MENCKNCGHPDYDHDGTGCFWRQHGAVRACGCLKFIGPSFEDRVNEAQHFCETGEIWLLEIKGHPDLGDTIYFLESLLSVERKILSVDIHVDHITNVARKLRSGEVAYYSCDGIMKVEDVRLLFSRKQKGEKDE